MNKIFVLFAVAIVALTGSLTNVSAAAEPVTASHSEAQWSGVWEVSGGLDTIYPDAVNYFKVRLVIDGKRYKLEYSELVQSRDSDWVGTGSVEEVEQYRTTIKGKVEYGKPSTGKVRLGSFAVLWKEPYREDHTLTLISFARVIKHPGIVGPKYQVSRTLR